MISHFFKLIWNKKRQHFLLILEIMVAYLVVFGIFSAGVFYYRNYAHPRNFRHENVWSINISNHKPGTSRADSLMMILTGVKKQLLATPGVRAAAYMSYNTPFSNSINGNTFKYNDREYSAMNYQAEDDLPEVLQLEVTKGRWYAAQDAGGTRKPVVINELLEKEMFPNGESVGKEVVFGMDGTDRRVIVGVIKDMKHEGDYATPKVGIYERADTGFYSWTGMLLLRVDPSVDAAFEGQVHDRLTSTLKGATIEIQRLPNQLARKNREMAIPVVTAGVIAAFLVINVALGMFGVLWYNISRRRQEIGLRRAIGATAGNVSWQIMGEMLVLTTIAILLGLFFAVQFPLLDVFNLPSGVYVTGMLLATLFVYVLVFICSIYPGREAAAIYPAIALHED
ncbi:ABC transporter permease [Chitinophaga horti]|uniref:ABC transporter permease n=1 Tax=Chitinophaga horti TaxID=2920382 RepID=A0ABY6J890_9BACT|nr:FtsX-like permease family protein [Chitinophaga horti]UYQ95913.1 ABC transporter permease [Chitinophaga horti]